jgi:hypothetical protein
MTLSAGRPASQAIAPKSVQLCQGIIVKINVQNLAVYPPPPACYSNNSYQGWSETVGPRQNPPGD